MTDEGGTDNGQRGTVAGSGADGAVESRPMIDGVFEVLADWRRREICLFFVETDARTATVDELALLVAGCRPAISPVSDSHDDVVAALEGTHLPLLDRTGVIDFDDRSGVVRYRGHPTVEKWLEHVTAVDGRLD